MVSGECLPRTVVDLIGLPAGPGRTGCLRERTSASMSVFIAAPMPGLQQSTARLMCSQPVGKTQARTSAGASMPAVSPLPPSP